MPPVGRNLSHSRSRLNIEYSNEQLFWHAFEPEALEMPERADKTVGQDLHDLIASRAYELYEARGFQEGFALSDWLQAEEQVLTQLKQDIELPLTRSARSTGRSI